MSDWLKQLWLKLSAFLLRKKAVNWQRPLNCARKHFYHMRQISRKWLCCRTEWEIVPSHRSIYRSCTHPHVHEKNDKFEMDWKTDTECSPIKSNDCQCRHATSAHREVTATASRRTATEASPSQQTLGMKQPRRVKVAWTLHNGSFCSINSIFTIECS